MNIHKYISHNEPLRLEVEVVCFVLKKMFALATKSKLIALHKFNINSSVNRFIGHI